MAAIRDSIAGLLADEAREQLAATNGKLDQMEKNGGKAPAATAFSEPPSYVRPKINATDDEHDGDLTNVRFLYRDTPERRDAEPSTDMEIRAISQIANIMWFPTGTTEAEQEQRLLEAVDALHGIGPNDELEGMLACQMIVTHRAALDCLQLSMSSGMGSADRARIIAEVESLLSIYARDLEILDRHRGKKAQDAAREVAANDRTISQTLRILKSKSTRPEQQTRH